MQVVCLDSTWSVLLHKHQLPAASLAQTCRANRRQRGCCRKRPCQTAKGFLSDEKYDYDNILHMYRNWRMHTYVYLGCTRALDFKPSQAPEAGGVDACVDPLLLLADPALALGDLAFKLQQAAVAAAANTSHEIQHVAVLPPAAPACHRSTLTWPSDDAISTVRQ